MNLRPLLLLWSAPAFAWLALLTPVVAAEKAITISSGTLRLTFDRAARTVALNDTEAGDILDGFWLEGAIDEKAVASNHESVRAEVVKKGDDPDTLVLHLPHDAKARLRLIEGKKLEVEHEGAFDEGVVHHAVVKMGERAIPALLAEQQPIDGNVLVTSNGPAEFKPARSIYDPDRDLALSGNVQGGVWWKFKQGRWQLLSPAPASGAMLTLTVRKHYYRDELGAPHFVPRVRQERWPTAPVVCMTWYGIEGWKGNPAQRKPWLMPNIEWVAKNLAPYASDNLVFQLDDNYPQNDDKYMRELSDAIRQQGLVPGVWFTPFVTAPPKVVQEHADWFLRNEKGDALLGFAGVNWGWAGARKKEAPVLNVGVEGAAEWYARFWTKARRSWNFEFLKIDGMGDAVDAYRKGKESGGLDAFRKGLQAGREIVGPEAFINGCWGTPLEGLGLMNGCRTGPDTGNEPHTARIVVKWNYLNNIGLWCDPDAAANLHKATVERARLNALLRVLTGQQFVTDDVWTEVKPEVRRVWQQSFPSLDIRPNNLYAIEAWRDYDMLALRVARPWGSWDVVGLLNYEGQPAEKILDLTRLPLEAAEYHVYDFFAQRYLGKFSKETKLPRLLAAYEGQAFAIVPDVPEQPVLLSTSRHISQGVLELKDVVWTEEPAEPGSAAGKVWSIAGTSTHLVASDPYELVFAPGPYRVASVKASVPTKVSADDNALRVTLTPEKNGAAKWQVTFAPQAEAALAVSSTAIEIRRGGQGRVELRNRGAAPVKFKVTTGETGVKVSPVDGQLAAWPAKVELSVSPNGTVLEPGHSVLKPFTVEAVGTKQLPQTVEVKLYAPPVENLARKAKATASSALPGPHWTIRYDAKGANDHDATTRWNAGDDDKQKSWLELNWPEAVEFDRVEIDECIDGGPRINAWRLEARNEDEAKELATGKTAGRHRIVVLPKPVKTARLRLDLETSAPAALWEVKVYRTAGK